MAGAAEAEQGYSRGVLLVVLATLGWSMSGIFVRHLPDLNGWQINSWRGYWMAVALLVYLVAVYGKGTPGRFRAIPPVAMVACASFFALGSTLYVTALTLAGTANVSCLAATAPIFTALLSRAVTGERPDTTSWLATAFAIAGVSVVMRDGISAGNLLGNMVAMLVALSFACQTVILRRYRGVDMVPAICVGGFGVFVVGGLFGGLAVSPANILVLAAMGAVQLGIPLIFFVRGARSVPAVTISLIALLDVVLNPLWSWIGAGEQPSLVDGIGGTVIIAAVTISVLGSRMRPGVPLGRLAARPAA